MCAKLQWLHDFEDMSLALYDYCLGKTEIQMVPIDKNISTCNFIHEKSENDAFYNEADQALEERRQQIIKEVFDWLAVNFLHLWD
jgi:hypothetical protein